MWYQCNTVVKISIHALLAESDNSIELAPAGIATISIHALLAESDLDRWLAGLKGTLFLSTLSLRRATRGWTLNINGPIFLSTLSLRRATQVFQRIAKPFRISIHALLAESDQNIS